MSKFAVISEDMFDKIIELGYVIGYHYGEPGYPDRLQHIAITEHNAIAYKRKLFEIPLIENVSLDNIGEAGSSG